MSGSGLGSTSHKFLSSFFSASTHHSKLCAPFSVIFQICNEIYFSACPFLPLWGSFQSLQDSAPRSQSANTKPRVKSSRKPGQHRERISWEPAGLIQHWLPELMRSKCPSESESWHPPHGTRPGRKTSIYTGCTYMDIFENVAFTPPVVCVCVCFFLIIQNNIKSYVLRGREKKLFCKYSIYVYECRWSHKESVH